MLLSCSRISPWLSVKDVYTWCGAFFAETQGDREDANELDAPDDSTHVFRAQAKTKEMDK